jgi:hypothetical protein
VDSEGSWSVAIGRSGGVVVALNDYAPWDLKPL